MREPRRSFIDEFHLKSKIDNEKCHLDAIIQTGSEIPVLIRDLLEERNNDQAEKPEEDSHAKNDVEVLPALCADLLPPEAL